MIMKQGQLEVVLLNELDHHPLNVRSIHEYEQAGGIVASTACLGQDIYNDGVLSIVLKAVRGKVGERHLVFDGNRRLEGLLRLPSAQRDTIKVQVVLFPSDTGAKDVIRMSASANEGLKPTWWSKAEKLVELAKLGVSENKEIAATLKVSEGEVSQLRKLAGLPSVIQLAGLRGLIAATEALSIVKTEGDKAEAAILKYLTDHPNEVLTRLSFSFTKAADSLNEIAAKANKETTAASQASVLARQAAEQAKGELARQAQAVQAAKEAKDKAALAIAEKAAAAAAAQATAAQAESERLGKETDRLQAVENAAREDANKAAKLAAAKRKGGKGTGSKRKTGKDKSGQGKTDNQKFVEATEIIMGKLEACLTNNFEGASALENRAKAMAGMLKLCQEFRGKFLKT